MVFASPYWLWALLAAPLVAAAEVWAVARDRERTARLVARPLWDRVIHRPAERWRYLRLALVLAGVTGLVLALARPQWGIIREKVEREGVDVVLLLDTSGSMATEDVPPTRSFVARAALSDLLGGLSGDRVALVAFAGEAYTLVPLTLDADVIGLFLETLDPGVVPAPGSSLGQGLARGLDSFVDPERRNKVLVLVSDGEDLEGEVEAAVTRARQAGVVVHAVGVGTERGGPVPDLDADGSRRGFKKAEDGSAVISRLRPDTLEAIARGTGGRFVRATAANPDLTELSAAIAALDQRTLAREFVYRKKERFQLPLAAGFVALCLAFLLPPLGRSWWTLRAAAAAVLLGLAPAGALASDGSVADEVLLRARRHTRLGLAEYARGNHPAALKAFEAAVELRPEDARARFNLAAALLKNGKREEAEVVYRSLAEDADSPLAPAARYNLGNTLFEREDYQGAAGAYRDALRLGPDDDTRRNLELALRALKKQQEQEQQQQQQQEKDDPKDRRQQDRQQGSDGDQNRQQRPQTPEQRERERFEREAGMPKERAMQLLDALQQNEKAEQKKALAGQPAAKKKGKDW